MNELLKFAGTMAAVALVTGVGTSAVCYVAWLWWIGMIGMVAECDRKRADGKSK